MKEQLIEKAKKPIAYMSKTTEMWGMRLMMIGTAAMTAGATWGAGLLGSSMLAYGLDKAGDKIVKTEKVSEQMFGEKPSIWNDIRQALRIRLLPSPAMARAGA